MEEWLSQLAYNMPYVAVIGIILLSGFGLPFPEDVPLILAGYLAGIGLVDPYIMFPACFIAIVGADTILFLLGHRYGHHVPKLPLIRRYLTEARLVKAEQQLLVHGGKFIFVARFLPGLRAPAMFAAGVFKYPLWKFLVWDGTAAAMSVPLILGLAYYFADHLDAVRKWVHQGQIGATVGVVLVVAIIVGVKIMLSRRAKAREASGLASEDESA